jgi:hypothetical protein
MHLLDRGFAMAVASRAESDEDALRIRRKQLVGLAGIASERLARALGMVDSPDPVEAGARLLAVHPLLNPAAYVDASFGDGSVVVRPGPAHEDEAWISLCGPDWTAALQAAVRGLDPRLDLEVTGLGGGEEWRLVVELRDEPAPEAEEVAVTKFSSGTGFRFEPRRSLPITPA